MPHVEHLPIHPGTHLKNSLFYIDNPEKASEVTAINCPEDIDKTLLLFEINNSRRNFKVRKDQEEIIAHHYHQSFAPGSVTAKEAHQIGVELAKIIAPEYMVHVSTHTDRNHIHNHILIGAVNPKTGYKYRHTYDQYKFVQEQSDALCMERGIPVIENPKKRERGSKEYRAGERGKSWKENLTIDIDRAIKRAVEKGEGEGGFISYLKEKGYIVKWQNKNISIQLPGNKAVRVDTLAKTYGGQYSKDNIERRLRGEAISIDDVVVNNISPKWPEQIYKGNTSRFNEYDRYKKWCEKNNRNNYVEVGKREPPPLDIYKDSPSKPKIKTSKLGYALGKAVKYTPPSKGGKTRDEREIEMEMEDLGRTIGRLFRNKGYRYRTIKGTWTINKTINRKKVGLENREIRKKVKRIERGE